MLIFHGGLPRSGKSFEAVKKHLVPALKSGRHVYARIDGLDYPKIAQVSGISVDRCAELLHHVEEGQVSTIDKMPIPVGSLIVIDEVQNYFPDARKPLSDGMTKFVAEHGHQGLDILLMGQEFKDMHKLWKNRVSQKVMFNKLDMLGKGDKYRWKLFKAIEPQKFAEVSAGEETYDKDYFGTYKSFVPGAENNQLYDDKRASIWSSRMVRRVLPIAAIAGAVAIYYVYHAFTGGGLANSLGGKSAKTPASAVSTPSAKVSASSPGAQAAAVIEKKYQKDFIEDLSERYRLRVSAIVKNEHKLYAVFEWFDESLHVKERLSAQAIAKRGYDVMIDARMETATITKGNVQYVATQFPLETEASVSDARQRQIAGGNHPAAAAPVSVPSQYVSPVPVSAAPSAVAPVASNSVDGFGLLGKVGKGVRKREYD